MNHSCQNAPIEPRLFNSFYSCQYRRHLVSATGVLHDVAVAQGGSEQRIGHAGLARVRPHGAGPAMDQGLRLGDGSAEPLRRELVARDLDAVLAAKEEQLDLTPLLDDFQN